MKNEVLAISFIALLISISAVLASFSIEYVSTQYLNNTFISDSYIQYNISVSLTNFSFVTLSLFNAQKNLMNFKKFNNFPESYNMYGNFSELSDGVYYLNVTLNDTSGNFFSLSNKIIVDTTPPKIYLIKPFNNEKYIADIQSVRFVFNVSDNFYVTNCSLYINNKIIFTKNSINNFETYEINIRLNPGIYSWYFKCTDTALNKGYSNRRSFTIIESNITSSIKETTIKNATSDNITIEVEVEEEIEKVDNKTLENKNITEFSEDEEDFFSNLSDNSLSSKRAGANKNCIPNWDCDEWKECKPSYKIEDIINNSALIKGEEKRLCKDLNNCFYDKIQERKCTTLIPITTKKVIKCNEEYIEVYSNEVLVSRLLEDSFKNKKLELIFSLGETYYCEYCYDGMKNHDEEGIDCGGQCPKCREFIYKRNIMDVIEDMFNTLYNLFLDSI